MSTGVPAPKWQNGSDICVVVRLKMLHLNVIQIFPDILMSNSEHVAKLYSF
jgi:hypothetical protein